MGRRENLLLLPALAALAPLANATEIISTSTFTTIFPTTAVVTSSSAIAGCTEAVVWQETCSASYSGGTIISIGSGLSLRACASGCAVQPACSATVFEPSSLTCYMFSGDVTITPGGGYQAAARYAADASNLHDDYSDPDPIDYGHFVLHPSDIFHPNGIVRPSGIVLHPTGIVLHPTGSIFDALLEPAHITDDVVRNPFVDAADPFVDDDLSQHIQPGLIDPVDKFADQSSGGTPITTISTVTTTEIYTITSCAASVTNCPANQQTTYLTTETITYVTTICPEDDKTTATQASGSTPTNSDTGVIQTANPQHVTTQTTSLPSAQGTETSIPLSHMTTSTVYVTEIDVITACPPSVHNCPAGQESTYTISKTVPAYTTTYLVADTVIDSAQVAQSTGIQASVQPVVVPTGIVSPGQATLQTSQPADVYNDYTVSHSPSTKAQKPSVTFHASVQVATHATTMSTISGGTISAVTTNAPAFNSASKMGRLTSLPIVLAVMSTLFLF
ncbi:hypothetical protein N7481_011366 [Penicillium waksmanii]|uniref:uncharacterized protein n=1 Tax=Penicillium waksmanii TaxID=69791 RepID=UPI0025475874|nr:uncharacterized protein N7481_011366 [Penicillium waksmanii]KAJ5974156.1 hypothetical protein N7481_011366 [Penicillium waksmanii]